MPPLPPSFDAPAELDWDCPLYSTRQEAVENKAFIRDLDALRRIPR